MNVLSRAVAGLVAVLVLLAVPVPPAASARTALISTAVPIRPGGAGTAERVTPGWTWPLPEGSPTVVRGFDPPRLRWLPGHRGVDLAADPGGLVVAAGAGVVAFAGDIAGRGVVSVDHSGGLRTTYEPVEALVSAGQPVGPGTVIGRVQGRGHCAAGCLHWGLRRGLTYLDPMLLVAGGPPRLLPLTTPRAARGTGRPALFRRGDGLVRRPGVTGRR